MRRSNAESKSCGKLYELWHDRRSFPVRLRIALLCAAAFCFTVIVFGPLELFIGNSGFFPFSFGVVWPAMAVTGVVACAVITAVLLLVRGKVYNTLVSLLFSCFCISAARYGRWSCSGEAHFSSALRQWLL